MKRGFLAGHPPAKEDATSTPAERQQRPPASFEGAGWAECLELLRGPSDERRFVGLLLVTKLLPSGDAAAIKQVHDAVGDTFLSRLLLPARQRRAAGEAAAGPPPEAAALEKQAASCALGLAVLSSFVRVPELAASEALTEKLPLLLNVARAGGITELLLRRRGHDASPPADGSADAQAADAVALQDALECAAAVAAASEEGRRVAAESGAAAAAAQVLQACAAPPQPPQLALVMRLLVAVFGRPHRAQTLLEQPNAVIQLVPALARVFALPAMAAAGTPAGAAASSSPASYQQLATVQLEALHVLLLLLPLPPGLEHVHAELAAAARGAEWPHLVRAGLGLLLRGRVSAVQRHSALQLAAAMVDLLGPDWVLGGPWGSTGAGATGAGPAGGAGGPGSPTAFFQVLAEVARIETSVLLLDALGPNAQVPASAEPGTAAAHWHAPQPRAALAADDVAGGAGEVTEGMESAGEAAEGMETDVPSWAQQEQSGDASADMEGLYRVLDSDADRRALQQELERERRAAEQAPREDHVRRVDEAVIPQEMRWEGPHEMAGERAARVLPACFELLEACIECLAVDSERAQGAGEGARSMDADGGSPGAGAVPWPPALPGEVALRALCCLEEAIEAVLQFLEQSSGQPGAASSPLLLASARVLARFCAEVPAAFAGRVQQLLPFLLSLRASQTGAAAASMPLASPDAPEDLEAPAFPAEGTLFMLPALLQAVQVGSACGIEAGLEQQEQRAWLAALAQPTALRPLVAFTAALARQCAKLGATASSQADEDDHLVSACALLLAVLQPLVQQLVASTAAQQEREAAAAVQLALPVLRLLLLLAPRLPAALGLELAPLQHVRNVHLLSTVAALAAVVVAGAAVLLAGSEGNQEHLAALVASAQGASLVAAAGLILGGLQAAAQLLQEAAAVPGLPAEGRLEQVAVLAAGDAALQEQLCTNLATLCTMGEALLPTFHPFAQAAARHSWLAGGAAASGAAKAAADLVRGTPAAAAALNRLLRAARAAQAGAMQ